jgi:hypothetical protein
MRIKLAVVLLLVAVAVLAGNLLLGKRALSPSQLVQVKTACQECHSMPAFANASDVHARHPQVDCAICHPRSPPVVELTACKSCHGEPRYERASVVHDRHAALNCSHCHGEDSGLLPMDRLHNGIACLGLVVMIFILTGITANFIMANRKTKAA